LTNKLVCDIFIIGNRYRVIGGDYMCTILGLVKEKRSIDESIVNYKNKMHKLINDGHMTTWHDSHTLTCYEGADTIKEAIDHLQNVSDELSVEINRRQNKVIRILSIFI